MIPATMNRPIRRAASLALIFLLSVPAIAQDVADGAPTESWKISRSNNLVVRSGPTSNDYIVTKIKNQGMTCIVM